MKLKQITLKIIVFTAIVIFFNNCKKKEVVTEVNHKVAYLNGGYLQTCTYDFDMSTYSRSISYSDTSVSGTDTIVKNITLVYNNFDYIYVNDTTNFYKTINISDTTGSEVYVKQLDAESDLIIRPFNVLQVTLVCNINNTSYNDGESIVSDSMPVFTYKPFNNTMEGTGSVDENNNVSFSGNFFGGSDMNYDATYSFDNQTIEGSFEGKIKVNFEFRFNGKIVEMSSINNKEISNGKFTFKKLY